MKVTGDDFLRAAISQPAYFVKLIFNSRGVHFFPATTEHRDATLPGICYRDDSQGDALAATIKPTQIDIRLHQRFSASLVKAIVEEIEQALCKSERNLMFDVNYGGKLLTALRIDLIKPRW